MGSDKDSVPCEEDDRSEEIQETKGMLMSFLLVQEKPFLIGCKE